MLRSLPILSIFIISLAFSQSSYSQEPPNLFTQGSGTISFFDFGINSQTTLAGSFPVGSFGGVDVANEFIYLKFFNWVKKFDYLGNELQNLYSIPEYWQMKEVMLDLQNETIFIQYIDDNLGGAIIRLNLDGTWGSSIASEDGSLNQEYAIDPKNKLVFNYHLMGGTSMFEINTYEGDLVGYIPGNYYDELTVAPEEEYIFYSDNSNIYRRDYDGLNDMLVIQWGGYITDIATDSLTNKLFWANAGNLYSSDYSGNNIESYTEYNLTSGSSRITFATPPHTETLACYANNVYIEQPDAGLIYKLNQGTCYKLTINNLGELISQSYDCSSQPTKFSLFWGDTGSNSIKRVDREINVTSTVTNNVEISGIVADSENDELFFILTANNTIEKMSFGGLNQTTIYTVGQVVLENLTRNPNTGLLYFLRGNQAIYSMDSDGANSTPIIDNISQTTDFELDHINGEIYWVQGTDLKKANDDGTNVTTIFPLSTVDFNLDLVNNKIYWINSTSNFIQRSDFDGTNVEDVIAVSATTIEVKVDAGNSLIYWMEPNSKIFTCNLSGEDVKTAAWLGEGTHMALDSPLASFSDLVSAGIEGSIYFNSPNKGIIFTSPDGNCWQINFDANGDPLTTSINCPIDLFGNPTLSGHFKSNIFLNAYQPNVTFTSSNGSCYGMRVEANGDIEYFSTDCP